MVRKLTLMADNVRNRVVVTGMGVISPLGLTPDDLWSALREKRSGVSRLTSVPSRAIAQ